MIYAGELFTFRARRRVRWGANVNGHQARAGSQGSQEGHQIAPFLR